MFGLQTGVFTNDLAGAWRAFAELEVGGVIINDVPTYRIDHMPYGGVKDSGLGREGLRWAIEDMTEIRIMVLAQPAAERGRRSAAARRRVGAASRAPRRDPATGRVAWLILAAMDLTLTPGPARAPGAGPRLRREVLQPREAEFEAADGRVPRDWGDPIRQAAIEARLHGGSFPVELGGQGWSALEQVLVHEQLGQVTGGLWSYIPGAYNALIHCDAEQRARYLDPCDARRALGELRDHRGRRRLGRRARCGRPRSATPPPASTSSTARSGSSPGRTTRTS